MAKCEFCGSELKLDLYTRSYYCEKCKSNNEQSKNDFLIIYNELNDLNRETFEAEYAKKLIDELKKEYSVEVNQQINNSKMIVIFASKSSYLYSFRKYWSMYLDKSIVLVLNNLRRDDLPLELRDRCIIDLNNEGYIEEVKNEFKLLKEVINEHILNLKENIDSSFNNQTLKDAIDDDIIKNKINSGIKDNPILEKTLDICNETHVHENNNVDDIYEIYDLLTEMKFAEAIELINKEILKDPNNAELYLFKLMATIKAKNYEVLQTYPYKSLSNFDEFNKAYSLGDDNYKSFLLEILKNQTIELKYFKAKSLKIDEYTKISQIKYAMSLLDEVIPYKDSSKLYNYYEEELNKRLGESNIEDKIINATEKVSKKINPIVVIVIVFLIIFLTFIFI